VDAHLLHGDVDLVVAACRRVGQRDLEEAGIRDGDAAASPSAAATAAGSEQGCGSERCNLQESCE
jgi:hypothetical protein